VNGENSIDMLLSKYISGGALRDSILSRGGLRAIIDADGSCTLSVALLIRTSFQTNDLHGLQG